MICKKIETKIMTKINEKLKNNVAVFFTFYRELKKKIIKKNN